MFYFVDILCQCRVKQIAAQQERQYDLLKLIVKKMEIQTEADEQDEGDANPFKGRNGYVIVTSSYKH